MDAVGGKGCINNSKADIRMNSKALFLQQGNPLEGVQIVLKEGAHCTLCSTQEYGFGGG